MRFRTAAVLGLAWCLWGGIGDVSGQVDPFQSDPFGDTSNPDFQVGPGEPDQKSWDVPPDTPATTDGGVTLNPVLLKNVRDDTLELEPEDQPAYYYGLWLTSQLNPQTLADFARQLRNQRRQEPAYANRPNSEFPQFVDVFKNPDLYRGRPVTMSGYFRKLNKMAAGKNELGIHEMYEGWFYTDDSQGHPGLVIFTELPDGFPIGNDITEEIRFTGYFLKMYGYRAQDTTRKAPLFLARTVQWYPSTPANRQINTPMWVYGLLTAITVIAIWGLWQAMFRPKRHSTRLGAAGRDFDNFPPQEFLGPDDSRPVEPHH